MESWNRKWRTLWCWSNVYLGWKVAQARGRALPQEKQAAYWEQRHEHFANLVWDNIKELKGWWVKVGQFLSTRSDLLPQQYIHHLIKLQDMMPTTSYAVIEKALQAELGDLKLIFSKIDEKPLASASIGQVHRAWLKDGTAVVVKVQHADVESLLMHDMTNLKQLSWAFGMLEPGMNFAPILEEWQKAATKELDFRYEFAHQQRAYEAAQRSRIGVIIPKCYPNLVTKSVMVMDFIDGFKVTDTAKLDLMGFGLWRVVLRQQYGVDRRELMYRLCDSFAYQIHIDGLFNGDPHPGNILVSVDPVTKEAFPVILDWGLVKEFDSKGQTAFSKLVSYALVAEFVKNMLRRRRCCFECLSSFCSPLFAQVYSVASMDVMGLMEAFENMGFQFKEGKGAVIDPEIYMDALRLAFRLNVHIPFLQIMVRRAQECLFNRYQPPSPLIYTHFLGGRGSVKCSLNQRLSRLLCYLVKQKLVLGCQVAVYFEEEMIVDVAIGQMGPVDTRPVTPDSLFCGYCTTKGLLSTALLQLVSSGELELDDAVSSWWDGFIRYGKRAVTVQQLLTHRAGLHRALPSDLTLSRLADYSEMVRIVEDAPPACAPGALGRYAYLTYGWAVSELVRCVSGIPIDTFIRERLLEPLDLEGEIFMRLPEAAAEQAAAEPPSHMPAGLGPEQSRASPARDFPTPPSPRLKRRSSSSIGIAWNAQQSLNNDPALRGPRHSSLSRQRETFSTGDPGVESLFYSANTAAKSVVPPQPESSSDKSAGPQGASSPNAKSSFTHSQNWQPSSSDINRTFLTPDQQKVSTRGRPHEAAYHGDKGKAAGEARGLSSGSPSIRVSPNPRLPQQDGSVGGQTAASPLNPLLSDKALEDRASVLKPPAAASAPGPRRGPSPTGRKPPHQWGKHQLSSFPKGVEIVQASTPFLWRLTSARRKISFSPMTQQEVLQRLERAKGKLKAAKPEATDGFSSAEDTQARKCIASAMLQRRLRLHNMQGGSGPLESNGGARAIATRTAESLPDLLPHSRLNRQREDERHKSEEEDGFSHSDAATEGPGTPDSDSDTPSITPAAPGAAPRVSVVELIRTKPHVMDPLIYDSHRIVNQLIPPTNCRCTARALARFYSALGEGRIISKPLLDAARVAHTVDPTLESLLLTGGGSRTWGLGYQLYDCSFVNSPGWGAIRPGQGAPTGSTFLLHSRASNFGEGNPVRRRRLPQESGLFGYGGAGSGGPASMVDAEALLRDRGLSASHPWGATLGIKPRGVVGLGHGDMGGSIAMCFPEMNLSICILLNDVLTGAEASQTILEFLLKCFGLQPKWQTQVSVEEVLKNLTPVPFED
ncbi:abc1 family protein [Cyclospora cayetanensis]|uniref:Abc1 family protein n=1 Tax=Cyclospora cayetanensis TaxID=88456 RepID=A0A1D3D010_9EIME|nr:abc1 family protein [Cyclospora cayetanensis]